jgi:hypothetical protein
MFFFLLNKLYLQHYKNQLTIFQIKFDQKIHLKARTITLVKKKMDQLQKINLLKNTNFNHIKTNVLIK